MADQEFPKEERQIHLGVQHPIICKDVAKKCMNNLD